MREFGLIGFPLGHSFSKKYFAQKFENEGITDARYELYPIDSIERLPSLINSIGQNLVGLNVTIPYKKAVIPYIDHLSPSAASIQAVNTILFKDGKKYGHNTDIMGFRECLMNFIPTRKGLKALILGTGGSAKAVKFVLTELGIPFSTVSRNRAQDSMTYEDIDQRIVNQNHLIINTTPLGMYPQVDDCPQLPYALLTEEHYLFDLIYNPIKTLFLQKGEASGAQIMNGMPMLIGQAEAAWKIWNQL